MAGVRFLLVVLFMVTAACDTSSRNRNPFFDPDSALTNILLPDGFSIHVYAEGLPNARSMTMSPGGILFVGTRNEGNVYAVQDLDGDFVADTVYTILDGMNKPNGVAFRNGSLFVAEVDTIWRLDDIENSLGNPPAPVLVSDAFPDRTNHGWKFIRFGPDDKLYVPVGAPCNICEEDDPRFATIMRMDPDGSNLEVFASGIRNTVGFDWHPETGELWFTDNGRDNLGDDIPPCELNHAPVAGLDFGFPYCHGGTILDPEYGQGKSCADYTLPAQPLGPHVAPLGMRFYTGTQFPARFQNQIFIAEHGSWNRSEKIGYRISLVKLDQEGKSISYEPFATGWLDEDLQEAWGRPVDLHILPDGSMLVSDDHSNRIYRIVYTG